VAIYSLWRTRPITPKVGFSDDVFRRLRRLVASKLFARLWRRPVEKSQVIGIHGTLFYGLGYKKAYYPSRIEAEMRLPWKNHPRALARPVQVARR